MVRTRPKTKRTVGVRVVALLALLALVVGCTTWAGPSRVREGALYRTGEGQYDAYFKDVHDVQVTASTWVDDKKSARKPLVDALQLTADSSDSTIAQLVHEQVEAAQSSLGTAELKVNGDDVKFVTASGSRGSVDALATALEATTRGEIDRAKKLKALSPRIDALLKTGHDLEPHAKEDFAKVGGQKPYEVKNELGASFDVLGSIESNVKREERAAESFVADLQRAVALGVAVDGGAPAAAAKPSAPKPPPRPAPAGPATGNVPVAVHKPPPPAPPPPPPAGDTPPPPKPPPPAPKPASTGEVFNP